MPVDTIQKFGGNTSQPHNRFSFDPTTVVLEVESAQFRLPTFVLKQHSPKLGRLVDISTSQRDESPIQLRFIAVQDFKTFLEVLFPSKTDVYAISSVEEWSAVLKVAHIWDFSSIQKLAVTRLEAITTPIDRIVRGFACGIPQLVATGYVELCRRDEPLDEEEGDELGVVKVLEISSIRRYLRSAEQKSGRHFEVVEFCSGPGRLLLQGNSVVDYLIRSLDSDDHEGASTAASVIPETRDVGGSSRKAPEQAKIPSQSEALPSQKNQREEAGQDQGDPPPTLTAKAKRKQDRAAIKLLKEKMTSGQYLCQATWQIKYPSLGEENFNNYWKDLTSTNRAIWVDEWISIGRSLDQEEVQEYARQPEIQCLV